MVVGLVGGATVVAELPLHEKTDGPEGKISVNARRSMHSNIRCTGDGVRAEGLVDVDLDAGVRAGVRAGEADCCGLLAAAAGDLKLGALHL